MVLHRQWCSGSRERQSSMGPAQFREPSIAILVRFPPHPRHEWLHGRFYSRDQTKFSLTGPVPVADAAPVWISSLGSSRRLLHLHSDASRSTIASAHSSCTAISIVALYFCSASKSPGSRVGPAGRFQVGFSEYGRPESFPVEFAEATGLMKRAPSQ